MNLNLQNGVSFVMKSEDLAKIGTLLTGRNALNRALTGRDWMKKAYDMPGFIIKASLKHMVLLHGSDVKRTGEKFSVGFWPRFSSHNFLFAPCSLGLINYLIYPVHAFFNDQLTKK